MRAAISYALENYTRQPDAASMARSVGMEAEAFQKTFSAWVGISPKRFVQAVTRQTALACLRAGESSLQVQLAAGLSSPSRLHDLMLSTDGMSPAQIRALGAGTQIVWGVCDSAYGATLVAWTGVALCKVEFGEWDALCATGAARVARDWPAASLRRDDAHIADVAAQCLATGNAHLISAQRPAIQVRGTGFQIQVWRALLALQAGQLVSYGDIAGAIGRVGASRAVGTAVGSNPISVLIPCHRVIQSSGLLGGYAWGLERKVMLLGQEIGQGPGPGQELPASQAGTAGLLF